MNIKSFTKERPFIIAVIAIIFFTVFLLFLFRPSKKTSSLFINGDNVETSLLDYEVRKIQNWEWNKGVVVESTDAGKVMGNTILISSSDTIVMYGWAVDIDRRCPASGIYMEVNGKFVKGFYGLPRPDIQAKVGVKDSSTIGFFMYFDRSLLENEQGSASEVKFHLIDKEKKMVISSVPFQLMYQSDISNRPERKIESSEWLKGFVLENFGEGVIYQDKRQIESVTAEEFISIVGWAVDIDHKLPLKSLYISMNEKVYKVAYGTHRSDVKEAVGVDQSDNVGFCLSLPRYLFENGDGTLCDHIEFYMEDQEGDLCEPIRYDLVKN